MIKQSQFTSEFDVSIADDPAAPADYSFAAHGASSRAIVIAVEPWTERPWTASFAAPDPGTRSLTALLSTPRSTGLCVMERGTAFLGDVLDPGGFRVVETMGPVLGAEQLTNEGLLQLLTPWTITAVDEGGVLWATERIAVDGLRVDEVCDGWVRGVADPEDEEPRDFALDLASGHVTGGAQVA